MKAYLLTHGKSHEFIYSHAYHVYRLVRLANGVDRTAGERMPPSSSSSSMTTSTRCTTTFDDREFEKWNGGEGGGGGVLCAWWERRRERSPFLPVEGRQFGGVSGGGGPESSGLRPSRDRLRAEHAVRAALRRAPPTATDV